MTVATTDSVEQFQGDGSTVSFSLPVLVYDIDHVAVTLTDTDGVDATQTLTTHYSVAGAGSPSGVTVTMVTAPAVGETLTLERIVPLTQEADYVANDTFPAESHERQLDLLTMAIQQVNDLAQRSLHFPASLRDYDTQLAALQAGKFWRTNLAGTGLEQVDAVADNGTFQQSGTGAIERTVDSKLGEVVSAKDFGAVGDGVTNDTAALQAAIDYCISVGRSLYIPAGIYKFTQLTIAVGATGLGPLYIYGDGTPYPQFNGGRGTLLRQIDGTTGTAITYTGNWSGSKFLLSMGIRGIGLYLSNALTGWGIDMFNVNGFASEFSDIGIYAPASTTAGLWRQRSCWQITMRNIRGDGPSSGSTTKGLVIYGDNATGTTNQTLIENINFVGCPKCNVQIGKWDESGGGTTQSIVWNSGQAGTASGYGVVIGRAFDVTITGVHTENHEKSGWLITESANGADSGYIKLINCDSYGDGVGGTGTADADTYTIQVKRTNLLHIDGFRMQEAVCGIWVDDTSDATNIEVDRVLFGGKSNNTDSETLFYIRNTTPNTNKRITVGNYDVAYTWGNNAANIIENGDCISYNRRTDANQQSTSTASTESVYPWTEMIALGAGSARSLENIVALTNYELATDQCITLVANTENTTLVDESRGGSGNFKLYRGRNWTPSTGDTITVVYRGGYWREVSRSYNTAYGTHFVATESGTDGTIAITNLTEVVEVNHSGATNLTDLVVTTDKEFYGWQAVDLYFGSANTTVKDVSAGGNFLLAGSADWNPGTTSTLRVRYNGTRWVEISRSVN